MFVITILLLIYFYHDLNIKKVVASITINTFSIHFEVVASITINTFSKNKKAEKYMKQQLSSKIKCIDCDRSNKVENIKSNRRCKVIFSFF